MEIENSIVSDKGLKNNADTPVTIEFVDVSHDDGVVFSGGQKQKLALARVLFDELMKNNGIYAKMFEMQSRRYQ